jgi:DNA mismatch repair protein MLH1
MLAEYFSFNITPTGLIESLPLLLRDYTPNLDKLPSLLMRLGPQVLSYYPQTQKRESNSTPS